MTLIDLHPLRRFSTKVPRQKGCDISFSALVSFDTCFCLKALSLGPSEVNEGQSEVSFLTSNQLGHISLQYYWLALSFVMQHAFLLRNYNDNFSFGHKMSLEVKLWSLEVIWSCRIRCPEVLSFLLIYNLHLKC